MSPTLTGVVDVKEPRLTSIGDAELMVARAGIDEVRHVEVRVVPNCGVDLGVGISQGIQGISDSSLNFSWPECLIQDKTLVVSQRRLLGGRNFLGHLIQARHHELGIAQAVILRLACVEGLACNARQIVAEAFVKGIVRIGRVVRDRRDNVRQVNHRIGDAGVSLGPILELYLEVVTLFPTDNAIGSSGRDVLHKSAAFRWSRSNIDVSHRIARGTLDRKFKRASGCCRYSGQ